MATLVARAVLADYLDLDKLSDLTILCAHACSECYEGADAKDVSTRRGSLDLQHSFSFGNKKYGGLVFTNDFYVIVAFTGTDEVGDVDADLAIALIEPAVTGVRRCGGSGGADTLERMLKDNSGKTKVVTGHSLGGTIALGYAGMFDCCQVFNPGSGVWSTANAPVLLACSLLSKSNVTVHHIFGDVISAGAFPGATVITYKQPECWARARNIMGKIMGAPAFNAPAFNPPAFNVSNHTIQNFCYKD